MTSFSSSPRSITGVQFTPSPSSSCPWSSPPRRQRAACTPPPGTRGTWPRSTLGRTPARRSGTPHLRCVGSTAQWEHVKVPYKCSGEKTGCSHGHSRGGKQFPPYLSSLLSPSCSLTPPSHPPFLSSQHLTHSATHCLTQLTDTVPHPPKH